MDLHNLFSIKGTWNTQWASRMIAEATGYSEVTQTYIFFPQQFCQQQSNVLYTRKNTVAKPIC